jgi:hypothetical protein
MTRRFRRFLIVACLVVLPGSAMAQSRFVRFEGRVQWIGGSVLSVAVNDGPSVAIDLGRVAQSDYSGLVQGDWVVVTGELSSDRRRILGSGITRTYGGGFQSP